MAEEERPKALRLQPPVAAAMRAVLPEVAPKVVAAVVAEVPSYADPFRGRMGRNIETAVTLALDGFLDLASQPRGLDVADRMRAEQVESVLEAAYALGQGEARSGRTMDALAAAYRVGARVAWRDMSAAGVAAGLSAVEVAHFAELVFAYIDELSDVSVSGHADELATTGRVRQRHLDRLTHQLLTGGSPETVAAAAEHADWAPPRTLTAVLLPEAETRTARMSLDGRTLQPGEEVPGLEELPELTVLLVPDAEGPGRPALRRSLRGREAVLGPPRPWQQARSSYLRALQLRRLGVATAGEDALDTEEHLVALVVGADAAALEDLRAQMLAPLRALRPATAEKLTDTLRSWLLRQGRRDEVAADLFVHAQTVRYRMGQLRELYGDRLEDPATVLGLVVALA
jgi:hypothetical protein